jgi:Na+-translocating ferredoxin:NAD+ oxidoreductase RnfG subunit
MAFKHKAVSTHIEFMFTRSMFQTEDLQKQHEILNEVAKHTRYDKTTLAENFGTINAENLQKPTF